MQKTNIDMGYHSRENFKSHETVLIVVTGKTEEVSP
jgi:hypothetical protein